MSTWGSRTIRRNRGEERDRRFWADRPWTRGHKERRQTRIDELRNDREFNKLPMDTRQVLLNLTIADDYFKALAKIEELQAVIDKKENDLYDIKHDLVAAQMKLEKAGSRKK